MASTYKPIDAIDSAKAMIKGMPIERVQIRVLNDVCSMLWLAAPWRWTVGALEDIELESAEQDYSITMPSDFLYLQSSYISDNAGNIPRILNIEPYIVPAGKVGTPTRIALISTEEEDDVITGNFRIAPVPGNIPTGWTVNSLYKKTAPVLKNSNINNAGLLVFDDEWFYVFVSGVLYYAYLFGDDQRAGGAQIDPSSGKVTFSGQRGVFEANILQMKQREKLMGMDTVQPEQKDSN